MDYPCTNCKTKKMNCHCEKWDEWYNSEPEPILEKKKKGKINPYDGTIRKDKK